MEPLLKDVKDMNKVDRSTLRKQFKSYYTGEKYSKMTNFEFAECIIDELTSKNGTTKGEDLFMKGYIAFHGIYRKYKADWDVKACDEMRSIVGDYMRNKSDCEARKFLIQAGWSKTLKLIEKATADAKHREWFQKRKNQFHKNE